MLQYVGGESDLIKRSQTNSYVVNAPPFCFLACIKPKAITKNKLLNIRILILQFPIVHTLIYIFYNIRSIEDPSGPTVYFLIAMAASIIPLVYGLNLLIRTVIPVAPEDYAIRGKYLVLQLVLLICKVQPAIGDQIVTNVRSLAELDVAYPMSVVVYKNCELIGSSF